MTKRELMTARDVALKAGDIKLFQELTMRIAELPMKGVAPLTAKDVTKYAKR